MKRMKRLKTLIMAMSALPSIGSCQDPSSFMGSVAEYCDPATGVLKTDILPDEKLLALRSQIQNLHEDLSLKAVVEMSKTFAVIIDSGAMAASTFDENDFVPGTYEKVHNKSMKGIAKSLTIVGQGMV